MPDRASDHVLDMAGLRSRLLAVQADLCDLPPGEATMSQELVVDRALHTVTEILDQLSAPKDRTVEHGSVDHRAVNAAARAALDALREHGLQDMAIVMIVQGPDQSRTLASTIANPQDVLRLVLAQL